jgi:hypothetical protein
MKVGLLTIASICLLALLYFSKPIFGKGDPSGVGLALVQLQILVVFLVTNGFAVYFAFKSPVEIFLLNKAVTFLPILALIIYLSIPSFTTSRYDIEVFYAGPLQSVHVETGGTSGIMKKDEVRKFDNEGDIKFFTISIGRGNNTVELLKYNNTLNQLAPTFASHMKFKFTISGNELSYVHEELQ